MKAITEFQITGMTLSGFKCFAEPTELSFGGRTTVTGGNGRGKSSIADAIAFAVTGLPYYGERGIDRLHCEDNPELFVSLRFTDGDGAAHELTRTRQKSRMTITYDGYEIRQHDLTDMFGEKDVFLSIFNPLYFIEELGDDGRSLLERYLPAISHEAVLEQLSESTRQALQGESLLSPETYLKKRRDEIRELGQTVVYITGQKDLADAQRREGQEKLSVLKIRLAELTAEAEGLEQRRFEGLDLSQMRETLVDLSCRYDETARDASEDTGERLHELHRKLGERSAEIYQPKYTRQIAEIAAKVKELAAKYNRELALYKGFAPGVVCPTCRRPVTEADIPTVQAELKKSITAIAAEGKEQKSQIAELQELESKTEATFLQFQEDDKAKLGSEIEELTRQSGSSGEHRRRELDTLRAQIQGLTAELEYGNLTQGEYDRLSECREEVRQTEAELAALAGILDKAPEDYDGQLAQLEAQMTAKKKLLADVAIYVAKRAEMTFSQLKMNRVEISLYDVVKSTGEVKDAFKFTYGGRRYDRLSLSEKIRAGMEVSELMKRLAGRNYPVFIDNMESVDDLANVRPTGQIVMARCVRGTALAVRPVEQAQIPKAA